MRDPGDDTSEDSDADLAREGAWSKRCVRVPPRTQMRRLLDLPGFSRSGFREQVARDC